MTQTQVVLIDQTHDIDPALLHAAALALNSQVTQDLASTWTGINAAVSAAPSLSALPEGAWPVFLVKSLPPGEGGFHMDKRNQPYARVIASAQDETWTIDASHEIIEMLVDPYGNRVQSSQAIEISGDNVIDTDGVFSYLVEACDPCEANNYAYDIAGIAVSDFITPNFYDASAAAGVTYSFRGNITRPRQMLPGGYISYSKPDGSWSQILWVDPSKPPQYNNLSMGSQVRSLRETAHLAMGETLDNLKHARRRDQETLPTLLTRRLSDHRARRQDKQRNVSALESRYNL